MGKSLKSPADRKRERESALLEKLQNEHGYMMTKVPKSQRITMTMSRMDQTARVEPMYRAMFCVPVDSALGRALAEMYANDKPKAKNR